jgi:adenylate cyclase
LFAYVTGHLFNLAAGILLFEAMEAISTVVMSAWRWWPGQVLLYGALTTHGGLALLALWRRRHLRMPLHEHYQTWLGLLIPVGLLAHIADLRLANVLYGVDDSFERATLIYWVVRPLDGLVQAALVVLAWAHGCLGIHFWLRYRHAYEAARPWLFAVAVLMPVLALIGFVNAGFDLGGRTEADPSVIADVLEAAGGPTPEQGQFLERLGQGLVLAYLGLVAALLAGRSGREVLARLKRPVAITYPGGRTIVVPQGTSVLETSRYAGLPHSSVCGGRARCSTCRVRILSGVESLAFPRADEAQTLKRIRAPANVRLACQIRPRANITVAPIINAGSLQAVLKGSLASADDFGVGREMQVAAIAVDMRDSTALAAKKLPFDALFIVDRFVQTVSRAVEAAGGHVVSVAGDGLMTLFGLHGEPDRACREALQAVRLTLRAIDDLNRDLATELDAPLKIGIGAAFGTAVVGEVGALGARSIQFLGDVGNLAARLEAATKDLGVPALVAAELLDRAKENPETGKIKVSIRGWETPVVAAPIQIEAGRRDAHDKVE